MIIRVIMLTGLLQIWLVCGYGWHCTNHLRQESGWYTYMDSMWQSFSLNIAWLPMSGNVWQCAHVYHSTYRLSTSEWINSCGKRRQTSETTLLENAEHWGGEPEQAPNMHMDRLSCMLKWWAESVAFMSVIYAQPLPEAISPRRVYFCTVGEQPDVDGRWH